MQLVECVPNFSEGRDGETITAIAASIQSVQDVHLLHIDSGKTTNRTVMTLAGPPSPVLEAAFLAIQTASKHIDMRRHRGVHPRIGATDVCPLIPLCGLDVKQVIPLSKHLAKRVGSELNIPVFLYAHSASDMRRMNIANLRRGEYEGLPSRIDHPDWCPDFGPSRMNVKSGATVIGARPVLIAYNINLNTDDIQVAKIIAGRIRESGSTMRDTQGRIRRDRQGVPKRKPGIFKSCRAVGWGIEEFHCAQVSTNLLDYHISPPHLVFEKCREIARSFGVDVTGSELVGLIPLNPLRMAGQYYAGDVLSRNMTDTDLVNIAVRHLGLDNLAPFVPEERILESRIRKIWPEAGRLDI